MNEQIEYFFDHALEEFKAENKHITIVVPNSLQRDFVEKFAELIIEECAKISESVTPRHTECGNKIAAKIRQFHGDKDEMV
jgi:hypothetical protein